MKNKKLLLGAIIGIMLLGNIFPPVLAQEETRPSSRITIRPAPEFKIEVWTDKESYTVGENITIYFKSNKDCYLNLFDLTPGGGTRLLFPNRYEKDNFLEANKVHTIPPGFVVTPPAGKGMIRAVATTSPWQFSSDEEIMRYHNENPEERYPIISSSEEGFAGKLNEKIKIIPQPDRAIASCIFNVTDKVVSQYGSIKVTSSPSNAEVYLDGAYRGNTPITLSNVEVGKRTVKVTKKDYYDYGETPQVKENVTTSVFAPLQPIPKKGSIQVTSSPRYARVSLDGIEGGTTPLTITDIEEGWHEIVIIAEYYRAYVEYLYVSAGEETKVEADLDRI